jgi:pimeloyl-ACP methyl ester carboxylesterase/predicted glycosyltransferase
MRAMTPLADGYVERCGVQIHFEVFGTGEPTILLLPTWSIVQSRRWKMQIPYLARHHRVVTFDGRGCGRSDRPTDPAAYADQEYAADAVAVLDATGTDAAVLVSVSRGAGYALSMATSDPQRVLGAVFVGPAVHRADLLPNAAAIAWDDELDAYAGWAKYNRHYWLRDWPGFAEFFMAAALNESHSTKQREDCVRWAVDDTDPQTIVATQKAFYRALTPDLATRTAQVRCPALVVHGSDDQVVGLNGGKRLAEALGCELVIFEGSGHLPDVREPVRFNQLVHDFVERIVPAPDPVPARRWTRALNRRPRVLYLSSPIGLGHARRDLAVATELRTLRPDVEVDWLTQHPVTAMLDKHGERVHPACAWLASESAHMEEECAEHDLHVFQAYRRMDEILCANFGVLHDVLAEQHYDLVIGDEAWETDYYLHENPECKRTGFVWMTDFVGWLPMPSGGAAEELLTADYNAEMIEQVARYPRIRDRSLFVGDPVDVVTEPFGPGLPSIRDWTQEHYDFVGYLSGVSTVPDADRAGVRAELGYRDDEQVCVVTVGGTGVGAALLRRVIEAYPAVHRALPHLRMVIVAGPRIDVHALPAHPGLDVRAFVADLWRHLAVCDVAVVQGGLTTTMELVANRRPFVYVPLRNHFEQHVHVRRRLERYRAGRCADYTDLNPDALAQLIVEELARPVTSLPVVGGGETRAAALIADLL